MKKVSTMEMLENGVSIGYSCVIKLKGEKPFGILDGTRLMVFDTKKEAMQFGENFDTTKIKPTFHEPQTT